jgi:uncharacterized membrane protein YtjA (UPF0391 family)
LGGIQFFKLARKLLKASSGGLAVRIAINNQGGMTMLYYAMVFLALAIVAGVFGFGGIASSAVGIAQVLFFIFLVALVVSVVANAVRGKPPV